MVYREFFGYWLVDAWWLVHYCFVDTDWLVVRFVGLIIGQKDLAFGLLISLCQHWEPAPVGRIWRIPSTVHQNKRCHGEWHCVYIYIHILVGGLEDFVSIQLGRITQTDELIFFRGGRSTTNQTLLSFEITRWMVCMYIIHLLLWAISDFLQYSTVHTRQYTTIQYIQYYSPVQ